MNVAGTEEDVDVASTEDKIFRNIAKREIGEELKIENLQDNNLEKIGQINFINKSPLLNLEWPSITPIFTYHLGLEQTNK